MLKKRVSPTCTTLVIERAPACVKWRRLAGGRVMASVNVEGRGAGGRGLERLREGRVLVVGGRLVTGCFVLHEWRCVWSWVRDGKIVLQRVH